MQGNSWEGVSVAELERASHTAVPALRNAFEGPFLLRAFLGGTGRANAVSALDPTPDAILPQRLERIEAAYRRLGLLPCFRSTPLDPPGLQEALLERGYTASKESRVMAGPLAAFAATEAALEVYEAPEEEWFAVLATAEHQTPERRREKREAAAMMMVPAAWLLLRAPDGAAAVSGQVAVDGPLVGFFDIVTSPSHRRQGLARRLFAGAAAWAQAQGGTTGWLQVSADNVQACALYESLGMREIYRYRYFKKEV